MATVAPGRSMMADVTTPTLDDPDCINWIRTGLGLVKLKTILTPATERILKAFHAMILSSAPASTTPGCTCTFADIKWGKTPSMKTNCKICSYFVKYIRSKHTHSKPRIYKDNCEPCNWASDWFEVAKAYMGPGMENNKSVEQTDCLNIIVLWEQCSEFTSFIQDLTLLEKVRKSRHNLMHSGSLTLTDAEMKAAFQDMVNLLKDTTLSRDPDVDMGGISALEKIRDHDLRILPEDEVVVWLDMLKFMDKSLAQLEKDNKHVAAFLNNHPGLLDKLDKEWPKLEARVSKLEQVTEDHERRIRQVETTPQDELREELNTRYKAKLDTMGFEPDDVPAHVHLQAAYVTRQMKSYAEVGDQVGQSQQLPPTERVETASFNTSDRTSTARRILLEDVRAGLDACTVGIGIISNWIKAETADSCPIPLLIDAEDWDEDDGIYDIIIKQLLGKHWVTRKRALKDWMSLNEESVLVIFDFGNQTSVPYCIQKVIKKKLPRTPLLVISTSHIAGAPDFTDEYSVTGLGPMKEQSVTSTGKEMIAFAKEHIRKRFDNRKLDCQHLDNILLSLGTVALAMIREGIVESNSSSLDKLSEEQRQSLLEHISHIGLVQIVRQDTGANIATFRFTHIAFAEFLAAKFLISTNTQERRQILSDILGESRLHQVLLSACNLASVCQNGALEDMFEVWGERMPSREMMQYIYQADDNVVFVSSLSRRDSWHRLSHIPLEWLVEMKTKSHREMLVKSILRNLSTIYISGLCTNCIGGMQIFFDLANEIPALEKEAHIDVYFTEDTSPNCIQAVQALYGAVQASNITGTFVIDNFSGKAFEQYISWVMQESLKVEHFGIDISALCEGIGRTESRGLSVYRFHYIQELGLLTQSLKGLKQLCIRHGTQLTPSDMQVLEQIIPECTHLEDFVLEIGYATTALETVVEKVAQKSLLRLHLGGESLGEKEVSSLFLNSNFRKLRIHDRKYDGDTRKQVLEEQLHCMTRLEELGLSVKYQTILDVVAPLISTFENLHSLFLDIGENVRLSGVAFGLFRSKSLRKLVLVGDRKSIAREEANELADCLGGLTRLCVFSIKDINLGEEGVLSAITAGLGKCASLAMLSFNGCSLKDSQLDAITEMLTTKTTIQSLTIGNNSLEHFDGESMDKFVACLKKLPRMLSLFFLGDDSIGDAKLAKFRLFDCKIE